MKIVDENYAYDELDGFKSVELPRRISSDDLWISASLNHISLSRAAKAILFETGYLQFAWNDETKQLLVAAAPGASQNAVRLPKSVHDTGFACRQIRELLERETKRDLSVVRVRLYGTKVKSRRAAIIFDLSSMSAAKIRREPRKPKG